MEATKKPLLEIGLSGSIAVVVGSGPGIGEASINAFAAAGCTVIASDINFETASSTAKAVDGHVEPRQVDVLERISVQGLFAEVAGTFGKPSIVVNVVGISRAKSIADTTDSDWDDMQRINLKQQFTVAQEAAKVMSRPASFIAVASINGVLSSPGQGAYGAGKAGLISLVRSLSLEFASEGLRFNAVAPGIVATPRVKAMLERTGQREAFAKDVPLGRVAEPEDIADVILWLGSPLARYVTGQAICVDGGASVKYPLPWPV
jgi:NAD(P)-dependent dehydrogenase (short-subunit alcohol dehydrogenase family)